VSVTGVGSDGLPRLRFIGRMDDVSDLVGEKLHQSQVISAIGERGFLVAEPDRPGYRLWVENPSDVVEVESLLRRNPYFDQALALGQLAPIRVHRLMAGWNTKLTLALAKKRGCRLGDVKPVHLLTGVSIGEVESWME
jgi:GH3 auxin-responsive promoter